MKCIFEKMPSELQPDDFIFFWGHTPSKNGEITETCLSQWWQCSFMENGIVFCCAEQYMMYKKAILFDDFEHAIKILNTVEPKKIKELGRQVNNFDEGLWSKHKERIVIQGNILKYSQNVKLRDYLCSTKDKILVEASPYDKIWGVGLKKESANISTPQKWKGLNLLGFILMDVRDRLKIYE